MMTKVIAAVFAAIIAPLTVAVGMKWAGKIDAPPDKEPPKVAGVADLKEPPKVEPKVEKKEPPPFGVIDFMTPNLAEHFYQYGWNKEQKKDMRSDTIDADSFRYEDKPGRIFVTGGRRPVSLRTKTEFEDYTLHLWYRWGEKVYQWTNAPPEGRPRMANLSVHITGPDGAVKGINPQCVTIRIGEGQAGTFGLTALPGALRCKATVVQNADKTRRVFAPEAPSIPLEVDEREGGYLIMRRGFPERPFDKSGHWSVEGLARGWHPEGDQTIAKVFPPYRPDLWNKVKIDCLGSSVKVYINNKLVNEITDLNVRRGRLGFTSQGADYEIGRFQVETQPPAPPPAKLEAATKKGKR